MKSVSSANKFVDKEYKQLGYSDIGKAIHYAYNYLKTEISDLESKLEQIEDINIKRLLIIRLRELKKDYEFYESCLYGGFNY